MRRAFTSGVVLLVSSSILAVPPLVIDDFVDPDIDVTALAETVGYAEPSSAVGGFFAGNLFNPFPTRPSSVTVNDGSDLLRVSTEGQASVRFGYGVRLTPTNGITRNASLSIEQDFSEYEVVRINFVENTNAGVDIVTDVQMGSYFENGSSAVLNGRFTPPRGLVGAYDVLIADLDEVVPGFTQDNVGWVSFWFQTIPATSELTFAIASIELIDLDDTPFCAGDCDDSGSVDFGDLVTMLGEFGNDTGDGCDADESGAVDFGDLVTALGLFGPCP